MPKSWFTIRMAASNDAAEVLIYDEIGAYGVSAKTRCSTSGRLLRPSSRSTSARLCCWTRKKTYPRPRRLALRRGRSLLLRLRASLFRVPLQLERTSLG